MVSARLDALIQDPIERTYLGAIDGYWAELVLQDIRSRSGPSAR